MNFSTFVVMTFVFGIMIISVVGYWKKCKKNKGCSGCAVCPMAEKCKNNKGNSKNIS